MGHKGFFMQEEMEFTRLIKQHGGIIYKITRLYTDDLASQKDLTKKSCIKYGRGSARSGETQK